MIEKMLTKIRAERIKKGYSQEYMASRLNISQSSYNKLENKTTDLTVNLLIEIAKILDIDITEILLTKSSLTLLKIYKDT